MQRGKDSNGAILMARQGVANFCCATKSLCLRKGAVFESVPGLSDSRLGGYSAMCRREGQRSRCPHVQITGNEDVAPPGWVVSG